ncbi:hypothetical protein MKW94_019159 [Papaver nudicaule]|uniref:Large ribosomal subunit protein uL10-like insertion domain-containing protein n=1 Tax=Papaver nudicaule TaxID=74823 RepID=A0AA41VEH8_PAPNU|nr:hypothetical protein [Papaver nudicaule]
MRLENLARLQFQKREATRARAMKKYYDSHLSEESNFRSDIKRYSSLYVFSFADANIQSRKYKDFIESLSEGNLSKVYFGFNKSLAKTVGLKKNKELRPGLHKVGIVLDVDDVGVLLTDHKTETEVISKFQEYSEFDFVKPGDTPNTTLVLEKNEVLQLPIRKSATKLFPILQKLGMPIKLSGRVIQLTDTFVVCEKGVPVTENASKILKHLSRKMLRHFVVPLCRWSAETGKTDYYPRRR